MFYGFYSAAHPSPSADPHLKTRKFSDGATISYNTQSHELKAILPDGGKAVVTASGGITANGNTTINGNVTVNGTVHATQSISAQGNITSQGDVKAGSVSLKNHKHPYTDNGAAMTTEVPNS